MMSLNPLLLVGGVIGTVSVLLLIAYACVKDKKTAMGFERSMADGEILRRLFGYAKPYLRQFVVVGFLVLFSISFDIDGHKEFYLSTVVFQHTTAEPEKKKLQAIQDAAVQAVQENYQDEPHVEAQVAMLIANQAADNDNKVTVEQVRQQLAEEYPLAAVPFDDYVEKSDVLEPAQAQQPVTVSPARIRRMESRSIHTASGIEVKIPTEILSEDSAVEFLHAEDGSVSLLIKNVIL